MVLAFHLLQLALSAKQLDMHYLERFRFTSLAKLSMTDIQIVISYIFSIELSFSR